MVLNFSQILEILINYDFLTIFRNNDVLTFHFTLAKLHIIKMNQNCAATKFEQN